MGICRKALCIIFASLFALSVFAAPGGGGGGGGGSHGGGSRGGGGPGGGRSTSGSMRSSAGSRGTSRSVRSSGGSRPSSESNRTDNSSRSVRQSQSKTPGPTSQVSPSSSVFSSSSPDVNAPSFGSNGSGDGDHFSNSPDQESMGIPSSNEKILPEMINYRGNRILSEGGEFVLQNVRSERTNNNEVTLEISFNQSVNPLTFSVDSILIDGAAISSKTKFSFNKKGDTIRIAVPNKGEKMNLMIQNVESFDGTVIAPVQIEVK